MKAAELPEIPRRIRKFLRDGTTLSVARIDEALRMGRVETLTDCGRRPIVMEAHRAQESEELLVFPDDTVWLDGRLVERRTSRRYFVLNKPSSVTTTTHDPRGRRDLSRWLADLPPGTFPLGRLDRETTGALLLADDGDLASAVLRPEHRLSKVYWLWVNDHVPPGDPRLDEWLSGMPIKDQWARAETVEVLDSSEHCSELLVTLTQGINRQVRRMSRRSDFRLLHLHRRSVGPVSVDNQPLGTVREIVGDELTALWRSVGGRETVYRAQLRALHQRAATKRARDCPDLRLERWLECQLAR